MAIIGARRMRNRELAVPSRERTELAAVENVRSTDFIPITNASGMNPDPKQKPDLHSTSAYQVDPTVSRLLLPNPKWIALLARRNGRVK